MTGKLLDNTEKWPLVDKLLTVFENRRQRELGGKVYRVHFGLEVST